tara:strand:+ start:4971 stop:6497 length:1527 start_codon:yes stop_codon:yes gene_type:complete
MKRGTLIHSMLEAYLRDGEELPDDEFGRMAKPALERLPDKGSVPADSVERRFTLDASVLGVPFVGVIDLVEEGRITDHKTTSDWKYTKGEEELRADPQAQAYALDYVLRSDAEEVTFRHVYIRTKGGLGSRESSVTFTRADLAESVQTMRGDVARMRVAATLENISAVEYNLEACGDYGGCPHRATCASAGRQTLGIVSSLFMDSKERQMDTTDPLAALLAARLPINPPDGTPKMELPPPVEVQAQQELADLESEEVTSRRRAMRLPGTPGEDGLDVLMTRASKGALVSFAQQNKVLVEPPEGRAKPGIREYRESIEAFLAFTEEHGDVLVTNGGDVGEVAAPVVEVPGALTEGGTFRRCSCCGEGEVARNHEETRCSKCVLGTVVEKTQPVQEPVQEPVQVKKAVVKREGKAAFTLFLNACPRGQVTFLEDILAPIAKDVEEESGVPHYLLLEYNAGPKKVAAVLAHRIRSGKVELRGSIVVDTRLPASEPAVEVLLPFASDVVRTF